MIDRAQKMGLLLLSSSSSHSCFKRSLLLVPSYISFASRGLCTALGTLLLALNSPSACRVVHAQVHKSRFINDGFIGDRLVSAYLRVGFEDDAIKLFDEIPQRDLVSWNSLITGFSGNGRLSHCFSFFSRMRDDVGLEPNEVTLMSLISACTQSDAFVQGKSIHAFAIRGGMLHTTKVCNSLINMYGKFGAIGEACFLFDSMPSRSLITWNSMLNIHAQHGFFSQVISVFSSMRRDGVEPDQASMVSLLQSCKDLGITKPTQVIHGYIFKSGFTADMLSATLLVHSYAKSGQLAASKLIFNEIVDPDRVAWTVMLASYALHGRGREAIKVFQAMVNSSIDADHVTFVHLLSACSHLGLVEEGKKFFKEMSEIYGIEPRLEHYSCMVDLFGRLGLLKEAYGLIETMPMEPNTGIWGALLGACRIHKNVELGKKAAENLIALEPCDHRNYIMLSNIYSASGQWTDASNARHLMKQRGLMITTTPGYSLFEHGNRIYKFVVGDQSHPESKKIHEKLGEVLGKIREVGFIPQTEFVLHDVDEVVKEEMISRHSEKLAIAFGLLVTGEGVPLTIIKNLRICGDCHSMAKFVSQVENRTIIIRDSKRFHQFTGGVCSCGNYW